ncbi:YHYH protein [Shimia sp.]|uniref:YHYH protein n=1 Tax=Shimia sp. TaxID=1954381 RepID=UPI00329A274B
MTTGQNIRLFVLTALISIGFVASSDAQGRPPMRQHTATQSSALALVKANRSIQASQAQISVQGSKRVVQSNGMPGHAVGEFPNRGNPNRIRLQRYRFSMAANPKVRQVRNLRLGQLFGIAVNGVPFDPGAAEFWQGKPGSGWQYEALGGAVPLGLDSNYAHVQPTGAYHYHGLPIGLMQNLGWSKSAASPLIGYAADGFPIYAVTIRQNGHVTEMTSSYRLKSGTRPGGNQPTGRHDGTFVQDYQYVKGAGTLDECNGAYVKTADYPNGTYAYFLTSSFPVIPRCLKGQADQSFSHRR